MIGCSVVVFLFCVSLCQAHDLPAKYKKVSSKNKSLSKKNKKKLSSKKKPVIKVVSSKSTLQKSSLAGANHKIIFEQEITHRITVGGKMRVTKLRRSGFISKELTPTKVCA